VADSRVVVDARALQLPLTGIGRYVESLLAEVRAGMIGVARPSAPVHAAGLTIRELRPDTWNAVWNELCLRGVLRDASAYWATVGQVPWTRPKRCRIVATIHDVIHRTDPHSMSLQRRLDLENSVRASVHRADVLTTTCKYVSDQLRDIYGRPADMLIEPAPTVGSADPQAAAAMRARLTAERPDVARWVLTVGQEVPRKNFVRLADAVAMLPGVGLVIAGPPVDPLVGAELESRRATVPLVRLGYTTGDELSALYAGVDVLAFVSLLEGYGMPLLDARSLGVRLVIADIPPLPEHAGQNAVAVDAHSTEAIAAGLRRALERPPPVPETLPTWADGARALRGALGIPGDQAS
jgi:glycosyltransferase involved in cell wall biosynthesis